uniref:Transcription factor AP-1 n=1 Tax=Lygus hesperus TaxID=30085 RepID=A0A0A9X8N4_LYGHE
MVRDSGELKMDQTSFYDDLYVSNMNREQMKRSLTLDFNGKGSNKRLKPLSNSSILSSPDVNKVCLSTPDMEKIILSTSADMTPTPTHTSILFHRPPTQEQRDFSQGFFEALSEIRDSDSSQGGVQSKDIISRTGSVNNLINLDSYPVYPFGMSPDDDTVVKDEPEPQLVPSLGSSSPVSPIDMESQEKYKLERKRLRNRVAASKCRKKKLERIAHLENKVKVLKGENSDLTVFVNRLREEVCRLKEEVINHVRSGCKISHQASLQHL